MPSQTAGCTGSGESAISGVDGKVVIADNLVARVKTATVNPTRNIAAWGDSSSAGYTARKGGRKDGTGNVNALLDCDCPIYALAESGDGVESIFGSLALWQTTAAKDYWAFPCAYMSNFQFTIDVDNQEPIAFSFDFAADGIFYRPNQTGAPTYTLPASC